MNDDLVRVEPLRTSRRPARGRAAGRARAAAADRRRGARGGGQVSGVLRRADREPAAAGGVRAGRGAVPGSWCAAGRRTWALVSAMLYSFARVRPSSWRQDYFRQDAGGRLLHESSGTRHGPAPIRIGRPTGLLARAGLDPTAALFQASAGCG